MVTAKIALVNRVYEAGLERRVTPPPGEQAIVVIAQFALEHKRELDDEIQALVCVREPLDARSMALIVEQHGRLTRLLQGVSTDGKAPRSFASKYLHFHRPVVPIYDEYARSSISRLVPWDSASHRFPSRTEGDRSTGTTACASYASMRSTEAGPGRDGQDSRRLSVGSASRQRGRRHT